MSANPHPPTIGVTVRSIGSSGEYGERGGDVGDGHGAAHLALGPRRAVQPAADEEHHGRRGHALHAQGHHGPTPGHLLHHPWQDHHHDHHFHTKPQVDDPSLQVVAPSHVEVMR